MAQKIQNKLITIFGNGNQKRDFLYVDDLCSAIAKMLKNDNSNNKIYNLGSGKALSINQIFKKLNYKKKIHLDKRNDDIEISISNINKIGFSKQSLIKLKPKFDNINRQSKYKIIKFSFGNKNRNKKFYVIKRTPGGGFFSNLLYVIVNLKLAEKKKFIPVVDMCNFPTNYNQKKNMNNEKNIWNLFFQPVSKYNLNEVYKYEDVEVNKISYPINFLNLKGFKRKFHIIISMFYEFYYSYKFIKKKDIKNYYLIHTFGNSWSVAFLTYYFYLKKKTCVSRIS